MRAAAWGRVSQASPGSGITITQAVLRRTRLCGRAETRRTAVPGSRRWLSAGRLARPCRASIRSVQGKHLAPTGGRAERACAGTDPADRRILTAPIRNGKRDAPAICLPVPCFFFFWVPYFFSFFLFFFWSSINYSQLDDEEDDFHGAPEGASPGSCLHESDLQSPPGGTKTRSSGPPSRIQAKMLPAALSWRTHPASSSPGAG